MHVSAATVIAGPPRFGTAENAQHPFAFSRRAWSTLPPDRTASKLGGSRRAQTSGQSLRLQEPDVAELDRYSVFLEHDRAGGGFAEATGGAVRDLELLVIV